MGKKKVTFNIDKKENFSEWFTEIVKDAELADLRYNIKGFVVFRSWSVLSMEKMYDYYEKELQSTGHLPLYMPSLIPESNLTKEASHVEGFTPEVFWVDSAGKDKKFEERYALRPTSETAFYQMYSHWIRSYNDLPFKRYQRAQVWRCEGKATRPFIRSREFYWIEAHNAFATLKDAEKQVVEDMKTTKTVMHDIFGIPFIFFRRPEWDKFAGAVYTFAADSLMPDGKIIQLPSTHLLGQNFSKPFDVKFKNKEGKEDYAYITCYGPAISRIFASLIAVHGDNFGLVFPFEVAPFQIVIVPVVNNAKLLKEAEKIKKMLSDYRVVIDGSDKRFGEKMYHWEMKGVPLRLELGERELEKKEVSLFRRDLRKRKNVKINSLVKVIEKEGKDLSKNLISKADKEFKGNIVDVKDYKDLMKFNGKIARVNFCSVDKDGEKCAAKIEKEALASVRGTRIDKKEKASGKCIVCGKKAKEVVYIAKSY
jgi:prolyl-tRNA synthetase